MYWNNTKMIFLGYDISIKIGEDAIEKIAEKAAEKKRVPVD